VRNLGDIEVGVVIIGNDLIGLSGIEGKFKWGTIGYRLFVKFEDTQSDDDIIRLYEKEESKMKIKW
jgi:hypothetical protein